MNALAPCWKPCRTMRAACAACSLAEEKLVAVADEFISFMIESERRAIALAADLIKIDEQERKERADLGTRSHDALRPPASAVGTDVWTDRHGWAPHPKRPTR